MRKQDYVSIEVAKLLQEKGFREPCKGIYSMEFKDKYDLFVYDRKLTFEYLSRIPSKGIQFEYLAPTIYEARDWIMKKYNIVLLVDWNETFSSRNGYSPLYFGFKIYKKLEVIGYYETMEQALDAGILYVLKNEDLWQRKNLKSVKCFSAD